MLPRGSVGASLAKFKGMVPQPRASIRDAVDFASIGMTIVGMPAPHANGPVCAAPPGVITSADLPLRAFAGRFGS
jgi:4-hydroxy-tetrahydrodipicolinate reductase